MYDLPKGTHFDFLKDREVELACFSAYSMTLHFGDRIQIQIEGPFRHVVHGDEISAKASSFPIAETKLMRLLTERVTKVVTKRDGTLTLGFSNGDALVIDGNVGPYEAYSIQHPGGVVVV
jgi:hypothetical protein